MTDLRHRAALTAVLLGCVTAVVGCGDDGSRDYPNEVDVARLGEVQADPALAGGVGEPSTADTGSSDSPYHRAQIVVDGGAATPAQLTAKARAAGWRITSVSCRDATQTAPGAAVTVQAFRTMPAGVSGGGAYTVALRIEDNRMIAVVPYHADAGNPWGAPDITIPAEQSCAETPAAAPRVGQAVPINQAAPPTT